MIPGMTESMTKKIGVKGITCTLPATFLFLSVGCRLVMAQTSQIDSTFLRAKGQICFFDNPWNCSGSSICCHNVTTNGCCNNTNTRSFGFSVSVKPPSGRPTISHIYLKPRCARLYAYASDENCLEGENRAKFGSGSWQNRVDYIHEAELGGDKSCNKTVSTDTFQYKFITEDRRRASWVLPMASLAEADSDGPLRDLPAEEQVIWFKSRGATLEVEDHQTTPDPDYTPVPDNNKRSGSIGNPRP